jgi:hypothetical protein
MDLAKAFDTVPHNGIKHALELYNIPTFLSDITLTC